jgi:long-chain acyl-CoA synthetase
LDVSFLDNTSKGWETVQAYPQWPNLAAMLYDRSRTWPEKPMLRGFRDGIWHSTDWRGFACQAASLARGLAQAGIRAGDRVLIVSENRPEFVITETALLSLRAVAVPTYVTNTLEDHAHIIADSGARAAIVSDATLAGRVLAAARLNGGLDLLVCMGTLGPQDDVRTLAWHALIDDGQSPDDIIRMAASIGQDTLACLIYTSGTGGAPKGVMLAHRSIMSNCRGAQTLLAPLKLRDEVYLSFLPLSHSYEHTVGQYVLPSLGTEIVYARGVEHLAADMLTVRPTIMTAVPRVLEVIRARVLNQVARQPGWKQKLFAQALASGVRRAEGRMTVSDRLKNPLLELLVRRKVMARFGGRLRAAMSGGARLEPEIGHFFQGLGLVVMQGYGQTEAGPVISANPPDRVRIDTVGQVLDGVELRIADDGEILVRGDLVMDGYWNLPAATAEVICEGWLHTGDVGELDADGYLQITDRKKDMIVLSGGENVSPARIEGLLMAQTEIAQAVVYGEGRAGLSAFIVPAEQCDPAAAIARVNQRLSVTERIRHHRVVAPFTLENGLLTATQKIRRRLVLEQHKQKAESASF